MNRETGRPCEKCGGTTTVQKAVRSDEHGEPILTMTYRCFDCGKDFDALDAPGVGAAVAKKAKAAKTRLPKPEPEPAPEPEPTPEPKKKRTLKPVKKGA